MTLTGRVDGVSRMQKALSGKTEDSGKTSKETASLTTTGAGSTKSKERDIHEITAVGGRRSRYFNRREAGHRAEEQDLKTAREKARASGKGKGARSNFEKKKIRAQRGKSKPIFLKAHSRKLREKPEIGRSRRLRRESQIEPD